MLYVFLKIVGVIYVQKLFELIVILVLYFLVLFLSLLLLLVLLENYRGCLFNDLKNYKNIGYFIVI